MKTLEILIIICAVALVAFTIIFNVVRIIKGKGNSCCSGCSGDCECCCKNTKTRKAKK